MCLFVDVFIITCNSCFSNKNSNTNQNANFASPFVKKFSKDNGFIDSKGKIYTENEIKDKKNSILIILFIICIFWMWFIFG